MLNRFVLLMGLVVCSPVHAQQWNEITSYVTYIGPEDMFNSSGQRLTDIGSVIQQDRANFHRFGIRHPQDQGDLVFEDRALRAGIPQMVAAGGTHGALARLVGAGQPFLVDVFVCGYGATPSVILLASGGDHSGCY